MELSVQLDIDLKSVTAKLSAENHRKAMFYMLDGQVLPDMTIYVPTDGGELRVSGHVEDFETLVWDTPYAKVQYEGTAGKPPGVWYSDRQRKWFFANFFDDDGNFIPYEKGYTELGTGPHWDQVAKGNHIDDWLNAYLEGGGYD